MAALGSKGDNNSVDSGRPLHPVPFTYLEAASGAEHLRWYVVVHFRVGTAT